MRTHLSFPAPGFDAICVAAAPSVRFPERRPEAAAVGTAIAVAVALLLSIGGLLTVPSLLPIAGALFESVVVGSSAWSSSRRALRHRPQRARVASRE